MLLVFCHFFFEGYGDHRDLHVLTHSFPTRRSSDLRARVRCARRSSSPDCSSWAPRRWRSCRGSGRGNTLSSSAGCRQAPDSSHRRSEEHTSELQSLMRISYAVFCLKNKTNPINIEKSRIQQTCQNSTTITTK